LIILSTNVAGKQIYDQTIVKVRTYGIDDFRSDRGFVGELFVAGALAHGGR